MNDGPTTRMDRCQMTITTITVIILRMRMILQSHPIDWYDGGNVPVYNSEMTCESYVPYSNAMMMMRMMMMLIRIVVMGIQPMKSVRVPPTRSPPQRQPCHCRNRQ